MNNNTIAPVRGERSDYRRIVALAGIDELNVARGAWVAVQIANDQIDSDRAILDNTLIEIDNDDDDSDIQYARSLLRQIGDSKFSRHEAQASLDMAIENAIDAAILVGALPSEARHRYAIGNPTNIDKIHLALATVYDPSLEDGEAYGKVVIESFDEEPDFGISIEMNREDDRQRERAIHDPATCSDCRENLDPGFATVLYDTNGRPSDIG